MFLSSRNPHIPGLVFLRPARPTRANFPPKIVSGKMTVGNFHKESRAGRGERGGGGLSVHLNCRPLEMTVGDVVVGDFVTSFRRNIACWTEGI